jgi:hypothetical protein
MDGYMNVLDITDTKLKGEELKKEIWNRVKETQRLVIQTLPDVLRMTQDQFDELKPDMDLMYQSNLHLYKTPDNVMEVEVK